MVKVLGSQTKKSESSCPRVNRGELIYMEDRVHIFVAEIWNNRVNEVGRGEIVSELMVRIEWMGMRVGMIVGMRVRIAGSKGVVVGDMSGNDGEDYEDDGEDSGILG